MNVASRVGRKAGRTMEVDWSGPTMRLVDPATGEIGRVYLFVACLPFSRYSYVEPALDMKQGTWLRCHVHAFEFFGGGAPVIVPDNLKAGVARPGTRATARWSSTRPTRRWRPTTARPSSRRACAGRGTRRAPRTRSGRPPRTPSRRCAARCSPTWPRCAAVAAKVAEHNAKPFSRRDGSRLQCFLEEEKALLRPLPPVPYEICEWVYGRKVQANCHVSYRRNFYSVSHLLVGKEVDLRVTESKLEAFCGGERVATHPLFPPHARNRYSTNAGDMPEGRSCSEWDAPRIRRWADRIGPSCRECVDRLFASYAHDEQAFNGCLALLRLSNRYPAPRVERACSMALASGKRSPRYRDVEPVLKTNQDKLAEAEAAGDGAEPPDATGYVRGASFYGEE